MTGVWLTTSTGWDAAHEAGHLMGLIDRYTRNEDGTTTPYPFWETNIMGVPNGTIDVRNIEEILIQDMIRRINESMQKGC